MFIFIRWVLLVYIIQSFHSLKVISILAICLVFLAQTKATKIVKENFWKDYESQDVPTKSAVKKVIEEQSTINHINQKLSKKDHTVKVLSNVDDKELEIWTKKHNRPRQTRAATSRKERLWDYGVIPYVIEPIYTRKQKDVFTLAMEMWEESTCLVFKEKEPGDKNYLIFTNATSCDCCSFVGKQGTGGQEISIGKNCDKIGIVSHELGHAIGFWHEHSRPDRDKFVDILLDNVEKNKKNNFGIMPNSEVDSLNETYDFESIMHYSGVHFANQQNKKTILARKIPGTNFTPNIGQRISLSPGDIRQTNKLYNCSICGGTLREPQGSLRYVYKSGQPMNCQWRITAPYGERVQLNVTSVNIKNSKNCKQNRLIIRDGYYFKSPKIVSHCGNKVPSLVKSSGRRMWIELKTNGGLDKFTADYKTLCGGDIQKDEDVIASPSYPHSYLPDSHCVWNITVPVGHVVHLTFEYLDLEFNENCTIDFLEVRNGHGPSAALLGSFCGYDHPSEIKSTGNKMSLVFISDSEIDKTGFLVHFIKEMDECTGKSHGCNQVCINTIGSFRCECKQGFELRPDGKTCEKVCGGSLYHQGNITSPFFPNNYPPNRVCTWHILTHKDRTINLNFTRFDLEGNGMNCMFDYVAIYRDGGKDAQKKEKFCGSILPKPIKSDGHILKIEFKSDKFDEKGGFLAYFSNSKKGI